MSDPVIFTKGDPKRDEPIDFLDSGKTYEKFMEIPGMEFAWEITNTDPDPKKTFSMDAFEGLRNSMGLFVGSRVMRKFKATGRGPKKIQVHVTVSVDGEELRLDPDSIGYFTWSEGEHRAEGMKRK